MFIGDKSRGIEARMTQQELQGCLDDINEIGECHKWRKSTGDSYYQYRIWTLKDSLRKRITRAFANHPRPVKCTCGEYPAIEGNAAVWYYPAWYRVCCPQCIKHIKYKDGKSHNYDTPNEAILAWNDMMMKERNNNKV